MSSKQERFRMPSWTTTRTSLFARGWSMRAIEAKTFSGYGGLRQTEMPKPQPAKDRVWSASLPPASRRSITRSSGDTLGPSSADARQRGRGCH